jgi:chemotaxis protein CheX
LAFDQSIIEPLGLTVQGLVEQLTCDVQEVFSTMVGMENIFQTPVQIESVHHFENSVTAIVGLAGTYNSLVSLHTSDNLAMAFTSSMLGMEVTEVDDDVSDALGEIANMIAGSLKQQLSSGGADIKLSIPSIVTGKNYDVSAGSPSDTLTLRFITGEESFLVSATMSKE